MRSDDLYALPTGLPVPVDDGACDHLRGLKLPAVRLAATSGKTVDVSQEANPWLVIYCYPRTGRPDREPPGGLLAWNAIPGARGCTPQSCAYRDHYMELARLGATVYGLSTQDTEGQAEAVQRLHLPFPLLSDAALELADRLRLPTFTVAGSRLIRRLTLIVRAGRIEEVFIRYSQPTQTPSVWLNGWQPIQADTVPAPLDPSVMFHKQGNRWPWFFSSSGCGASLSCSWLQGQLWRSWSGYGMAMIRRISARLPGLVLQHWWQLLSPLFGLTGTAAPFHARRRNREA